MTDAISEIEKGERFAFGRNWTAFLRTLDEDRIAIAVESLRELLQVEDLHGRSFLDVGCGSGLLSLAARRLGARVHSLDFDPQSVACAEELRRRFSPDESAWRIEAGSALDADYLTQLGQFDVVYSWGVLHHTGDMWRAIDLVAQRVKPDGCLVLALYNDQGYRSRLWLKVKQMYCAGRGSRALVLALCLPWFFTRACLVSVVRGRNEFAAYRRNRGMSIWYDWMDWLGGLPFEVAKPAAVRTFVEQRGFTLQRAILTRRLGCNQFQFSRDAEGSDSNRTSGGSGP